MTTVAAQYGVSDVALKKVCKKLKVPTPGRGYWQKVKAGAKSDRAPLPKYKGPAVAHYGNTQEYEAYREQQAVIKAKIGPTKKANATTVSEQLRNPHPLVAEAHETLKRLWARHPEEKDPVWHLNEDLLDIRVSKSSAHRALRIMDAVLKALTNEGYSIAFKQRWGKHTYAMIEGEAIGFRLHERVKQVPHVKTEAELKDEKRRGYSYSHKYDHLPTGVLALSIEYYQYLPQKTWSDTQRRKLEDCLDDFVAGLKTAAAHSKRENEKRQEAERLRCEAEERRRLQAELRAQETAKFEELERQAIDWRRAQTIKEYIDALEASLDTSLSVEELAPQREYIAWAREKLAWLDPLITKEDRILGKREPKG